MANWAIGDIQGCFSDLCCLLEKIAFGPEQDTLWLVGDLVNRGPESLEVLRYVKSLGDSARVVLGNHDLHLLAAAMTSLGPRAKDTFTDILTAPDREELLDWLRGQPLLVRDKALGYVMTHAGIPPIWSIDKAEELAREVATALQSEHAEDFLTAMYGNEPECWSDELEGLVRLRVITNYLTRMRFCTAAGQLDLVDKTHSHSDRSGFKPWFEHPLQLSAGEDIVFGHWAALVGESSNPRTHALDTGCVWGNSLTAMRLEDQHRVSCNCPH